MPRTKVMSQITGGVWTIEVEVGARVEEGDLLILIESMKMEVPVTTPVAGTVAAIRVAALRNAGRWRMQLSMLSRDDGA